MLIELPDVIVGTTSPVDHTATDLGESSQLHHGWHLESFEVAGLEAFARPPPHVHRSKSRMSRLVRMPKSVEPLKSHSYGQIL